MLDAPYNKQKQPWMHVIYPRQLIFMEADITTNDLLPFHMLQFMQAATSYYVPTYVPTNLPTY